MLLEKEAVNKALVYVAGLYPPNQLAEMALEEVRLSDDERDWRITVGFRALSARQKTVTGDLFPVAGTDTVVKVPREYKEVLVDGASGEVKSMLIRQV